MIEGTLSILSLDPYSFSNNFPFTAHGLGSTNDCAMERLLPLPELLQSERTTRGVLLLQQEVTAPSAIESSAHGIGRGKVDTDYGYKDERQKRQSMENKARVALLLTRSFANFLSETRADQDALQLSELRLDDFFVYLDGPAPTAAKDGARTQRSILLGAETIAPASVNTPHKDEGEQEQPLQEIQILGKLLCSVFSLDQSHPIDLCVPSATYLHAVETDSQPMNPSKSLRVADQSLLSRLIETESFPMSVCRLLSDLLYVSPNGKADSPFESVEDVILDLEQMISQPLIFLHDPQGLSTFHLFGQVLHGRKEQIAAIINIAVKMEQPDGEPSNSGIDAVFVSGLAGSGKSALVQTVRDHLSRSGWTAVKAKFERSTEHTSRAMLLGMFDEVVSNLCKGGEGSPSCIDTTQRVAKSLLDGLGQDGLSQLASALPSVQLLFDGVPRSRSASPETDMGKTMNFAQLGNWQLICSLKKLLEAVLESERYIIICDDLQWADQASVSFITEILINIGSLEHICRNCLFVGLYREEEVSDKHPLTIQYSTMQLSASIKTTRINLSSLSKNDVTNMLMTEFRLPRRIVTELAHVVHKKTAGHALFIVELLNSLLRESTISYSSEKCRYSWDSSRIDCLQTGDSVAELIASYISSLSPTFQRMLHIISCFGTQTHSEILGILENLQKGIFFSIDFFIDRGILDRAGPIVMFTHDLIQQVVYESMDLDHRSVLHLEIGEYLGGQSRIDESIDLTGMEQLQLKEQKFYSGRSLASHLVCIACDQIGTAGPNLSSEIRRMKFAEWFLSAGLTTSKRFNFRAAHYYYVKGIEFLGEDSWIADLQLCTELHNGAVLASFALGEADNVTQYVEEIIMHAPFEDTLLAEQIMLRSLTQSNRVEECLSRGLEILRRLGVNIPLVPTGESIMNSVVSASIMASQYNVEQILCLCDTSVDESVHSISKTMDAIMGALQFTSSPFLPLVTCEVVKSSLQYGVCEEASTAFASYAMLKVALEGDYSAGRYWADIVREIIKKYKAINKQTKKRDFPHFSAHLCFLFGIDIWFYCPREVSSGCIELHRDAMKIGEVDYAMYSLQLAWRYKIMGGENLSVALKAVGDRVQLMSKILKKKTFIMKSHAILDDIFLTGLIGKSDDNIEGCNIHMDDLQAEADSAKDTRVVFYIFLYKMILGFFQGDTIEAETYSQRASVSPHGKIPEIMQIYYTFYRGLIFLQVYRKLGGDERLEKGRETMDIMRKWAHNSPVFENKWLLLKAEYLFSFHSGENSREFYEASINASKKQGFIHELAIAYELLGNYHIAHECADDARCCYNNAYVCYKEWGAIAVAEKLSSKHNLGNSSTEKLKHPRNWD